jgi:EAL domain-containing protein (putative c-di-GMP-specific phosphodiesterase class I)
MTLAGKPVLEYQPAVDLATGRLLGMEALVRWEHPTKGRIAPDILIPWAEENGDIVALNAWVMEAACCEAELWSTGLQLAVNCSMIQLRRGEASKAAARALETSGLNPDRLTIEVTERTINDDRAAADLRALADLGVHLAVDDVGTSWSSLQVLRKFAIEIVKIDRAFINNLEAEEGMNRAIVEAIIHVGHSLAMSTVAEGVESAQQAAILREFGADVGQGYFFAPPLNGEEAHQLATAEPRPIFSLGPGRESSATAAAVQHPFALTPGGDQHLTHVSPAGPMGAGVAGTGAPAGNVGAGNAGAGSVPAGNVGSASGGSSGMPDPFADLFPATPGGVPPVVPFEAGMSSPGADGASELTSYASSPAVVGAQNSAQGQSSAAGIPPGMVAPVRPAPVQSATFGPLTGDNERTDSAPGAPSGRSGALELNLDIGVPGLNGSSSDREVSEVDNRGGVPQQSPSDENPQAPQASEASGEVA